MVDSFVNTVNDFFNWTNENQGVVSILLFVLALIIGWISGIFQAVRRRPHFEMTTLKGPTLCTTFETGRKYDGLPTHRTAISLYLSVTNTGSAPSSVVNITVGYRHHISKFGLLFRRRLRYWPRWVIYWLKNVIVWNWIDQPVIAMSEFIVKIGELEEGDAVKHIPFLIQQSRLSKIDNPHLYLRTGEIAKGIVYFEGPECVGDFFPRNSNNFAKIKVKLYDVFGKTHSQVFSVPIVGMVQVSLTQ